ncbi:hypothetical protein [Geothrix sp. 21YS21S-2]|uniref:hypothetical protein n=1 Tax=Geothrix sp. 21YS21S-2 TaxID=3068893 RepID=UPI0027BAE01F|nr:hypothetical protein [Geothrix sp. 21YS21S-2]
MAKTRGQAEKKKRATEKRKQIEKAVLRIAAAMPDDVPAAKPAAAAGKATGIPGKP